MSPITVEKQSCGVSVHQQQTLDDRFTAVRSFDKALDYDPTYLEAFEAIANILNQDRDYVRQDRYYRKMLKRALENQLEKLVFTLSTGLGEINRTGRRTIRSHQGVQDCTRATT